MRYQPSWLFPNIYRFLPITPSFQAGPLWGGLCLYTHHPVRPHRMRGIDKEKRHEALSLPADTASLDKVEDVLVLLIQLRDRILLLADFAEA